MKQSMFTNLADSILGHRIRSICLLAVLTLSAGGLLAPAIASGESTLEFAIPSEVEKGLERAGITIETRRKWLDDSTVWIAGSIIIAGFVIAYAIRRKKA